MKNRISFLLLVAIILSIVLPIKIIAANTGATANVQSEARQLELILGPKDCKIQKGNSNKTNTNFSVKSTEGKYSLILVNKVKKSKPSIIIELNGKQIPNINTKWKNVDVITIPLSGIKKENQLCVSLSGAKGAHIQITICKDNGEPTINSSLLSISETDYDFGNVAVGTVSQIHTFKVTNTSSNKRIKISRSNPSSYDYEIVEDNIFQQEILPGENKTFSIRFRPSNAGHSSCNLTVLDVNSTESVSIKLSGTGTGKESSLMSISEPNYSFGYVYNISSPVHTFTFTNLSKEKSVNVNLSLSNTNCFELINDNVSGQNIAPGVSKTFDIKLKIYTGECSSSITAYDTYSKELLISNISAMPFSASGDGRLAVSDNNYDFGCVDVGDDSPVHSFIVFNVSAESNMKVSTKIDSSSDFEVVEDNVSNMEIQPRGIKLLKIKFKPSKAGKAYFNIKMTDVDSGKQIVLKLSGMGTENGIITVPDADAQKNILPEIVISESYFDFGKVELGKESAEHIFTITNESKDKDIKILMTRTNLLDFEIVDYSALYKVIPPGSKKTFSMKFKPSSAKEATCIMTLLDNDSKLVYSIKLTGTGIENK